jgi:hypothetical protein
VTFDRPENPHEAAGVILNRLEARVKNLSSPTWDEQALLPTPKPDPLEDDSVLERALSTGVTDNQGMKLLLLRSLQEAKLEPRLAMVAARSSRGFDPKDRNLWQFTDFLVGVRDRAGSTLWIDPSLRFAPAGTLDPDYQGTQALELDLSHQAWPSQVITLPEAPPASNLARYHYQITVGAKGEAFAVDTELTGLEAHEVRSRLEGVPSDAQGALMAERFQERWREMTISRSEVAGVVSPGVPVTVRMEGQLADERPDGSRREIDPFPTLPSPLSAGGPLPPSRHDPIVLPYPNVHVAVSEIALPAGYRLAPTRPLEAGNRFGTVSWRVEPLPDPAVQKVRVSFRVEVSRANAPAAAYSELKTFLQWIDDAWSRNLLLERAL